LCATASDGVQCVEAVRTLRPDLLLLDVEMPHMSGMEVLNILHREFPLMPIIMCSAYTARGAATTLEALARGAVDYVTKPSGSANPMAAMASLSAQLFPKIAALAERNNWHPHAAVRRLRALATKTAERVEIIGIGASTGGPAALELLLPRLPATFRAPVVIVQHMPQLFTKELAARLARSCSMPVRVAEHGTVLLPGTIWFAPSDVHIEIVKSAQETARVALLQGPPLHQCRPAVDHLFRSLAQAYGHRSLGVVLSGMGSDGLAGARAMVHAGGAILAQDEASSAVWGMPGRVVNAGLASAILPVQALAEELIARVEAASYVGLMAASIGNEAAFAA
jgi:two-component system chemotaxis response regulator CheB